MSYTRPSGTTPEIDAQSQSQTVVGISIALTVLSLATVSLRLFTRAVVLHKFGSDDWVLLLAQLLAIVLAVFTALEAHHGLGRHTWEVADSELMEQFKDLYSGIFIYNLAMNLVKVSFLLTYNKILQSTAIHRVCMTALVIVGIWTVVQEVVLGISCFPGAELIPSMASYCIDTLETWTASSVISMVMDFVIFTIPIRPVLKLQLPRKQRWLLLAIFCLGFFVCIISVIRISTLRESVLSSDPEWDNTATACWTIAELNTGLICASLPTLRPLFARMSPRWGSTQAQKYANADRISRAASGPQAHVSQQERKASSRVFHTHSNPIFTGTGSGSSKSPMTSHVMYSTARSVSEDFIMEDLEAGPPTGPTTQIVADGAHGWASDDDQLPTTQELPAPPGQIHVKLEMSVYHEP